jgi:hypothetical protein
MTSGVICVNELKFYFRKFLPKELNKLLRFAKLKQFFKGDLPHIPIIYSHMAIYEENDNKFTYRAR